MLTHMLRCLDGHYFMAGKLEDEVAAVAKALCYPYTPSKTAIATVGASHSWPPLLGLLAWLADLLRYHGALATRVAEEEGALAAATAAGALASAVGSQTHFWAYLRSTYSSYLAGEDAVVEAAEELIATAFDEAAAAARAQEATAATALEAAARTQENLTRAAAALPHARAAVAEVTADVGRLDAALTEMANYRDGLSAKREEKRAELAALNTELDRVRAEVARTQSAVSKQLLSADDVRRLKAEAAAMRTRIAATNERREAVSRDAAAGGAELTKRLAAVRRRDGTRHRDAYDDAHVPNPHILLPSFLPLLPIPPSPPARRSRPRLP